MFRYTRFGDTYLTGGNDKGDVGTGDSFPSLSETTDGFIDYRGGGDSPESTQTIDVGRVLTGDGIIEFADGFRALRALRGKRARLWRTWFDNETQEWRTAKLKKVSAPRDIDDGNTQEVIMRFEATGLTWNGAPWGKYAYPMPDFPTVSNDLFDYDFVADARRKNEFILTVGDDITVINEGNVTVREAIIDIAVVAVTNPITHIEIINHNTGLSGFSLATGISAGQTVRIDTGRKTVKRILPTVADLYSVFDFIGANEDWLPLVPGDNKLDIGLFGFVGQAKVTISYYDASI